MRLNRILLIIPLFILLVFQKALSDELDTIKPLLQFKNEDGIYVEQFDPGNLSDNRFTENNIVYTAGKVFTYNYSDYKKDKKFFFKPSGSSYSTMGAWEFVPVEEKDSNTITGIKMIVKTGLQGFEKISKDYLYQCRWLYHTV